MRRRNFLTFLGGATAWISTARAQKPRPVIGVLSALLKPTGSFDATLPGLLPAFYQGLGEAGFVEGRNISIEYRWAGGLWTRHLLSAADRRSVGKSGRSLSPVNTDERGLHDNVPRVRLHCGMDFCRHVSWSSKVIMVRPIGR